MPGMPQKTCTLVENPHRIMVGKTEKVTCFPLLCLKLHPSKNHLANVEVCLNSMIGAWKIFMHSDSSNRKPNARTNNHKYANHGHRKLKNYRLDSKRPHIRSGGVSLSKIPWMLVWWQNPQMQANCNNADTQKLILEYLCPYAVVTSLQFICPREPPFLSGCPNSIPIFIAITKQWPTLLNIGTSTALFWRCASQFLQALQSLGQALRLLPQGFPLRQAKGTPWNKRPILHVSEYEPFFYD